MELPKFGQNQNQDQYYYQQPTGGSRKKVILVVIGIIALLIALLLIFTNGGSKAGEAEMKESLQSSSDALGIIDEYENDLQYAPTKNDLALTQILLRGNFQKLNALYDKSFKPKKKFTSSPKIDTASKKTLDQAKRNNTLDSEIIAVLKPKITAAEKSLADSKKSFSKKDSVDIIATTLADLSSVEGILDSNR